jgi:predicted 2-oxoglutarate/Fe(II)-dependent dioxygenase YbiX
MNFLSPALGVAVYDSSDFDCKKLIDALERVNGESIHGYGWREAQVGYAESMKDYRDCVDIKILEKDLNIFPQHVSSPVGEAYSLIRSTAKNYASRYNQGIEYMEVINFVKYGVGNHFGIHSDDGFSYSCAVSTVMYLNDDYVGGQLHFPFIDYTYEPRAGQIVVFPSSFIYSHASLPVVSGTKYSAVTMFDYNDRCH